MVDGLALDNARHLADVSVGDLWLRYFGLGGIATLAALRALLRGESRFSAPQYDVLAHALNERFVELDMGHPVPYASDAS